MAIVTYYIFTLCWWQQAVAKHL